MSSSLRFRTVVLDVDSTVAGIEGIDWLAELRGPDVAARCADLTRRAMDGSIPIEQVYGDRMQLIAPSAAELERLGDAYVAAIAPDCPAAIAALRAAGVKIVLISGGLRPALLSLAAVLGVATEDLHAVEVRFTPRGDYAGFDASAPLTTSSGKGAVVAGLALRRPILAVGDGVTDLAMRPYVDVFAAFTGFVRREAVVRGAMVELKTFSAMAALILDGASSPG